MKKDYCDKIGALEKEVSELKSKLSTGNKEKEVEDFLLSFLNGATIKLVPEYPDSIFPKKWESLCGAR